MKVSSNALWQALKSPRAISKCKLNYFATGMTLVGMTFYSYSELKLFPNLLKSFFLDLLLLQFGYAAICLVCGSLLSCSVVSVKIVSTLTLIGLYLPMIVCNVLLNKDVYIESSFVIYSLLISIIFLFLTVEIMSFRRNYFS